MDIPPPTLPPPGDVFALAAQLVDIPSESFNEAQIADTIEAELNQFPLEIERVGANVIARTNLGKNQRVLFAGHTDTVPAQDNALARITDQGTPNETLWGLGSVDMKSGLAVLIELARTLDTPPVDATFIFYAREEVANEHNGLLEIETTRPDLLQADVAILAEPTDAVIEAGCQGTMHLRVELSGKRAHSARAWMGDNAVARLATLLTALDTYEGRRPVVDGCEYREALVVTEIQGGVTRNVIPDRAVANLNHRFAPDRTPEEAEAHVRETLAATGLLRDDNQNEVDQIEVDKIEVVDVAPAARSGLDHWFMEELVKRSTQPVRAKLGWTDVAFFAARGVPASNFGPGDPLLAHSPDEHVSRDQIQSVYDTLFATLHTELHTS